MTSNHLQYEECVITSSDVHQITSAVLRYYRFSVCVLVRMAVTGSKGLKYFFLLLLLICVHLSECKRSKNSGGKRTNSGGSRTTPRSHYTTHSYHHDIGFENVQHRVPQQNTPPIGFTNQHAGGGHQPQASDTFHKTNVNQVSNSNPSNPSAPLAPPPNNPSLGFENVQQRIPSQNNQPTNPIGFNVPQNGGGGYHPQSGAPNNPNFGPPQSNQPGFNVPQNAGGGYHPQSGAPNNPNFGPPQNNQPGFNGPQNAGGGYHPQQGYDNRFPQQNNQPGHPYGYNGPPNAGGGYHPQAGGQYPGAPNSGGYPGNYYQTPGGGVYNPQPYYNPHFASPNGIQPQIYQPVQQSSGSSLLGYAGTFAGGYLIGKLTSGGGGGGHDSGGDRQYTVHHYHHNRDEVPKQISVSDNKLTTCSLNETQGLCVPNTFPICLANGTIMCVTHAPYTVPCGINSTTACVISVLPCLDGNLTCNSTGNFSNTAVYIPCISNVTIAKKRVVENATTGSPANVTSDSVLNNTNVALCVTAIAEPKKPPESPVASYLNLLAQMAFLPLELGQANGSTTNAPLTMAALTENSPLNISTSTVNSLLNISTPTQNSAFNISSSTEHTTLNILSDVNTPGTVQPLIN